MSKEMGAEEGLTFFWTLIHGLSDQAPPLSKPFRHQCQLMTIEHRSVTSQKFYLYNILILALNSEKAV